MGTKARGIGLAIIMCFGLVNLAGAADWSVVPTISQRSEFNSNLNLSPTHVISDYILSLRPAADFNYTTEISKLTGHVGLLGQHYITHDNLDHIDQNYRINGRYQALPRLGLSLNSSYISDTTLIEELITSGLVIGRTARQSFYVGPAITYNLTERLYATANYNFSRVLYQAPQYKDYSYHHAGLALSYRLSNEKTVLINQDTVTETLYAGGNNFKSIGIWAGVTHKFTERWDAKLMGGGNISFYTSNTQVLDVSQFPFFRQLRTKRVTTTSVTPYIDAFTTYRWTNLTASAGLNFNQNPSAYGTQYQVYRAYASVSYAFTERLRGSLRGSFSFSNQTGQNVNSQYNYYSVMPFLTYQITEKLSVSPGYSFSNSSNLASPNGYSAHNHIAWIQFSYSYPIHYQK